MSSNRTGRAESNAPHQSHPHKALINSYRVSVGSYHRGRDISTHHIGSAPHLSRFQKGIAQQVPYTNIQQI